LTSRLWLAGARRSRQAAGMNKLCIFAGAMIFGILGSLLAGALGLDTFSLGSFLLSGIGSLVGVYVGWKVAQRLS
jgi:hypothetical protein